MSRALDDLRDACAHAESLRGPARAIVQAAAMSMLAEKLGAAARHANAAHFLRGRQKRDAEFLKERGQLLALVVEGVRTIESLDANELALHHIDQERQS
jgi:hypothetical protein